MSLFVKYKCQSAEGSHSRENSPCNVNMLLSSPSPQKEKEKSNICFPVEYYILPIVHV